MKIDQLKQGIVIRGSIFSESVKVLTVQIMGNAVKLIGQGINTNQVHQPILTADMSKINLLKQRWMTQIVDER